MVDTHSEAHPQKHAALQYTLEDFSLISKTGNYEDCEDVAYIGPHFVAVIDGATSKTERRWEGKTGGKVAAYTLQEAFHSLPHDATARQAVDILTQAIKHLYEKAHVLEEVQANPVQRAIATFVAISLWHREVWFVGDCQCLINGKPLLNKKEIDDIASNARSLFLEMEIVQGKTIEELQEHDTGRQFILPLLERQMLLQNNSAADQYRFSVIDGFAVPEECIRIQSLPTDIHTIVLASDGYPYLKESLEESEQALQELLHDDPLLFHRYRSTKGVTKGNLSFDDRAYVKVVAKKGMSSI